MIVRIIIRSDGTPRGHSIALDYRRESRDTPRVANMGVEIVKELQRMTGAPVQEKAEVRVFMK